MATRKTKAEAAAAPAPKPAAAARKRPTGATHAAPARKPAAKAPAPAVVNHEEQYVITREQIAELAYSYWEARGRMGGSEAEDWLRAEQELLRRAREASAV